MNDTVQRSRVVTWQDPSITGSKAGQISGMEFFSKLLSGELPPPPVIELLSARLESVEPGRAVFSLEPAEFHYNPIGVVHGGILATMLDSAVGCAIPRCRPGSPTRRSN